MNPAPQLPMDGDSEPSFDSEAILVHVDHDRTLLRELSELLFEDAPRTLDRIREAINENDADALWQSAHALKGAVSNFAAESARDLALEIELLGREGDIHGAALRLDALAAELDRLFADLQAFLTAEA